MILGPSANIKKDMIPRIPIMICIKTVHGIDKFSLFTMPEQFEYVLAELEKRCPNAVRGEVFKKK